MCIICEVHSIACCTNQTMHSIYLNYSYMTVSMFSSCGAGIMLLEKQLLVNVDLVSGERPTKRARGAASASSSAATTTWVEMARCV